MKKIALIFPLILIVIIISCENNTSSKHNQVSNQSFDSCVLIIRSSYNCYYEFTLRKGGLSDLKVFTSKQTVGGEQRDTLLNSSSFSVEPKSESSIENTIDSVKKEGKITSSRMVHAYRFELAIDGAKYLDVYGQNKRVDELLKVLLLYVKKEDDRCEFFELFRQSLKQTQ